MEEIIPIGLFQGYRFLIKDKVKRRYGGIICFISKLEMSSDPPKNYVSLMNNLKLDEVGHLAPTNKLIFVPASTET